eukprot:m.113576 g.113576  ORF g.113576 m.113576 type:complete len:409 (+) comp51866_c0_seq1:344-1570(+)
MASRFLERLGTSPSPNSRRARAAQDRRPVSMCEEFVPGQISPGRSSPVLALLKQTPRTRFTIVTDSDDDDDPPRFLDTPLIHSPKDESPRSRARRKASAQSSLSHMDRAESAVVSPPARFHLDALPVESVVDEGPAEDRPVLTSHLSFTSDERMEPPVIGLGPGTLAVLNHGEVLRSITRPDQIPTFIWSPGTNSEVTCMRLTRSSRGLSGMVSPDFHLHMDGDGMRPLVLCATRRIKFGTIKYIIARDAVTLSQKANRLAVLKGNFTASEFTLHTREGHKSGNLIASMSYPNVRESQVLRGPLPRVMTARLSSTPQGPNTEHTAWEVRMHAPSTLVPVPIVSSAYWIAAIGVCASHKRRGHAIVGLSRSCHSRIRQELSANSLHRTPQGGATNCAFLWKEWKRRVLS